MARLPTQQAFELWRLAIFLFVQYSSPRGAQRLSRGVVRSTRPTLERGCAPSAAPLLQELGSAATRPIHASGRRHDLVQPHASSFQ
eukprot:CAMPEP_0198536606 /NCGR_PEP_ID=MMETSP1462-20131121/42611_1 /TAXON_ID=1333877 /ORGANISM="Brandtodinium nutriculum, Strain RCC3387" /LENGTH=85 /DNA_ID=CAMNT_0044266565 /DNA_START=172 /DNA_END=426 /DNA_ORIENTATION=+